MGFPPFLGPVDIGGLIVSTVPVKIAESMARCANWKSVIADAHDRRNLFSERLFPLSLFRHPLFRHPLFRHPLFRHPLIRHPLFRHPLFRHPLFRPSCSGSLARLNRGFTCSTTDCGGNRLRSFVNATGAWPTSAQVDERLRLRWRPALPRLSEALDGRLFP